MCNSIWKYMAAICLAVSSSLSFATADLYVRTEFAVDCPYAHSTPWAYYKVVEDKLLESEVEPDIFALVRASCGAYTNLVVKYHYPDYPSAFSFGHRIGWIASNDTYLFRLYQQGGLDRVYCDPGSRPNVHGICQRTLVCKCDELKDLTDNTCTTLAPLTEWKPGDAGQFFTFPANNHNDAPRCSTPAPEKDGLANSCEKTNTSSADPIDCATGQKKYFETDYSGFGLDALSFRRLYESPMSTTTEGPTTDTPLSTGRHWQPRDLPSLSHRTFADGARATTFRLGHRIERIFFYPAGSSTYSTNTAMRGIELAHAAGNDVVTLASGQGYVFNHQGQISQDTGPHQQPRFTYSWTTVNGVDRLARVTNRFGRYLDYQYTNTGDLASLSDQDGVQVLYQYASDGKLLKVIYPDTTPELNDNPSKTYLYEDARYPDYVTGILNQADDRIAHIAYNEVGKATLSALYNGNDRVEVSYPTDGEAIVQFFRDVQTNAYREELYFYGQFRGQYRLTAKQITQCDNCDLSTETWDFNDQALLARHTSPEGTVTEWTYDAQDRLVSTTVGVGTPEAHTETVDWHDTLNEIESQNTATELTSFSYDAEGNRTNSSVSPAQ